VRELLFEEDAFEVHVRHPEAPPRVGIITPAMVLRSHSGDLPSLIMPPPCEVSFAVRPEDGDVLLRTAVGVDVTAAKLRLKRDRWVFGFEVLRNGETAFETTIESWRGQSASERFWRPVGGERGLPIAPGDVVRLRTWLAGPAGEDAAAQPPLTAGFGQLVLERRPERPRQRSSPAAPSVVLIVQDTHRADRLSSHGYPKPTTPHLDALAERGLRYENAYATASWTWPATASILTGLLPDAHGVTDDSACFLSGRIETLAEVLQGQGYLTAAFVCNPLISPLKNFDQGFARFDSSGRRFSKTDVILPEVLDWLDEQAGTRFFLYLHLVDPHAPHLPRAEDLMRLGAGPADDLPGGDAIQDWNRRLLAGEGHDASGQPRPERVVSPAEARLLDQAYDASIATGDHYVGRLLERLEHLGLEDETVVVFTSDHGEEWLDHGLVTHGQSVHRELMQVPLILAGPGLPRGVSCATPVSNRHLAPTLARLGGGELEAVEDALELSRPSAVPEAPVFFATTHGWWNGRHRQPIYGVRAGRWALHLAPQGADWGVPAERAPPGGQVRLYDVSADPGETRDLAGEEPQVAERLRQLVVERLQQLVAERPDVQLEAGAATLDMLRGLGYLEDGR
jgi:arylsulfatase A-like enzyme